MESNNKKSKTRKKKEKMRHKKKKQKDKGTCLSGKKKHAFCCRINAVVTEVESQQKKKLSIWRKLIFCSFTAYLFPLLLPFFFYLFISFSYMLLDSYSLSHSLCSTPPPFVNYKIITLDFSTKKKTAKNIAFVSHL